MLFRRKKKDKPKEMSWYDVTLGQFMKLKALNLKELDDQIEAANILLGINTDDMTWPEFCVELRKLNFLKEEMPKTIIRKTYTLNDRKYDCMYDLQQMNVARYMDYMNLLKEEDSVYKVLSVFLVPEGCEYGGGYDMDVVYEDIKSMNVVEAYGIFNFFMIEFGVCLKVIKDYLMKKLKDYPELKRKVSEGMESFYMFDQWWNGLD